MSDTLQKSRSQSASLDRRETSLKTLSHMTYRDFICKQYPEEITATTKLFQRLGYDDDHPKVERFLACRRTSWFVWNEETGEVRIRATTCGDRWCPMCAITRRLRIAGNVRQWIRNVRGPKLLTLTVKHCQLDLADQITALYDHFTSFRRNPTWKKRVRGGVWFVHVTWRPDAGEWHPHLHMIIDADWWEQKAISKLWGAITGGSTIVDIRAITNNAKVAAYVAKDAAKPLSLAQLPDDRLLEAHGAFSGRRMAGVWGSARAEKLLLTPKPPDGTWKTLGTWSTITEAAAFDRNAHRILYAWQNNYVLPPNIDVWHLENPLGDIPVNELAEPPPTQLTFEAFS